MGKVIKGNLTAQQERFCQLYATEQDCFGNGTQSYIRVFSKKKKPITYKTARTMSYLLLTNTDVISRIRELLDIYISDEVVDKELGQVILQYGDLSSKVAAIREYNKVKRRVEPEGILPQTININITSDEVNKAKARLKKKQ